MGNAMNNMIRYFLDNYLLVLGFCGQGLFFGRFMVQWIASEKQGRSVVPLAFWYFSIGGGVVLLIYAILKKDPLSENEHGGRSLHLLQEPLPYSHGTLQGQGLEFL